MSSPWAQFHSACHLRENYFISCLFKLALFQEGDCEVHIANVSSQIKEEVRVFRNQRARGFQGYQETEVSTESKTTGALLGVRGSVFIRLCPSRGQSRERRNSTHKTCTTHGGPEVQLFLVLKLDVIFLRVLGCYTSGPQSTSNLNMALLHKSLCASRSSSRTFH